MSGAKDELSTTDLGEIRSEKLSSGLIQPLRSDETTLVSEEEGEGPPSLEEGEKEPEDPLPERQQNKHRQRQKRENKAGKKKRHGARNQHRHKFFVKWLISKFDLERSLISGSSTNTAQSDDENGAIDNSIDSQGSASCATRSRFQEAHILDVAGGKGEVSSRLTMCHQQRVVMVDPRPADIVDCFERIVLPKIPNKWKRRLEEQRKDNPDFVRNKVASRFKQLVTTFDQPKIMFDIDPDDESQSVPAILGPRSDLIELQAAVKNATLIVGLHADGATEAIVDAALKYHKPFVVVPCCVFPNFFPKRRLVIEGKDGSPPQSVPVRSHEQFCQYLFQKDPRFVMEELPFEGRNIAIWWDGK